MIDSLFASYDIMQSSEVRRVAGHLKLILRKQSSSMLSIRFVQTMVLRPRTVSLKTTSQQNRGGQLA